MREEQPVVYRANAWKYQEPHVEYTPQCWCVIVFYYLDEILISISLRRYNQQQTLASMTQAGGQCSPLHIANEKIPSNKTCGCAFCYPEYGSEFALFPDFEMDIQDGNIYPSIHPFQQNFASNYNLGYALFPVALSSCAGPGQIICITSAFFASYHQSPPNITPHPTYAVNDHINHVNIYLNSPAPLALAQDEDEKELPMWCLRRLASDGELYPPGVGGPSVGMKTHNQGNITIAPNEIMAQTHVARSSSVLTYTSPSHSEIKYDYSVASNVHGAPIPFSGANFNASFGTHNSGIDYDPVAVHHDEILEYAFEVRPDTEARPPSASNLPAPFFPEDAGSWGYPHMNA